MISTGGECIWLSTEAVVDFLRQFGRGSQSKDYEIVASLFLAKFCEEQVGKKCDIGFPLKDSSSKEVYAKSSITIEEIAGILRKKVDEDTPVDVIITAEANVFSRRRNGLTFQLKRFGKGQKDGTDSLINYLNKDIKQKYAPAPRVSLVLFMECTEMDTRRVREEFVSEKFPFEKVMFIALSTDKKFQIGEFWPNEGMTEWDVCAHIGS